MFEKPNSQSADSLAHWPGPDWLRRLHRCWRRQRVAAGVGPDGRLPVTHWFHRCWRAGNWTEIQTTTLSERRKKQRRGLELSRLPWMDLTFEWSRKIKNKCCSPTCVLAARWKITSMFSVLKMWFTSRELHTSPCRREGDFKSCTTTCTTINLPAALWSLNSQSSSSSPPSFGGNLPFRA